MLGLVACADQPLGFGKAPPNEFLILTYPPLAVPPVIALRAPITSARQAPSAPRRRARQLLYGIAPKISTTLSSGEKAFLKRLGANQAQINIRSLIAKDRGLALYPEATTKKILRSP